MSSQNFLDIIIKLERIHNKYIEPNKQLFESKFGFLVKFNKILDIERIESKRAEITAHFLLATDDRALTNQETQVKRSLGPDQTELCALILASYGLTSKSVNSIIRIDKTHSLDK